MSAVERQSGDLNFRWYVEKVPAQAIRLSFERRKPEVAADKHPVSHDTMRLDLDFIQRLGYFRPSTYQKTFTANVFYRSG